MGISSREKGKRGERELASKLRELGYDARRGQQYCGSNGDADVVGLKYIHIECKRCEQMRMEDWISQAKIDSKSWEIPAVFSRKNDCEWLVTMTLKDWITLYKGYCESEDW